MKFQTLSLVGLVAILLRGNAPAADWPQYRGPDHDGTSQEKILQQWPLTGLHKIWKVPLQDGFSSFTIGGGKAFTLVSRQIGGAPQEVCVALDAASGQELWAAPLGVAKYDGGGDNGEQGNDGGDGPRSTPVVDGGKVYAFSSKLVLKCLDAATGAPVWSKDLIREHAGRNITWESAASPLIEGDLVLVAAGGPGQSLLAFDKNDGHVVWKGQSDLITQSTPVAATILGVRQVIFFTQRGLVSVVPTNGAVLWRQPFRYGQSTAISPVVSGDIVYCSASYGVGTGAYKITRTGDAFVSSQLWFHPAAILNNHWSTPVCVNGCVFGISGQSQFGEAPLTCVDLATGKILWSRSGFGPGGCNVVDGLVLVLSDRGDLVLVQPNPAGYKEIARSRILAGKCWNSVAISDGRIYARSTKEGVCLDVSTDPVASR